MLNMQFKISFYFAEYRPLMYHWTVIMILAGACGSARAKIAYVLLQGSSYLHTKFNHNRLSYFVEKYHKQTDTFAFIILV